ncbi:TIGR03747 family integrating conjugative element membrane protein [Citrobacter sp. S2-9]|uniref:TIGR03747 family integrating conjugative element membrane protein n=1 Tax=Citrobacter enshiensis TaxID=2971264 RepID=A0ABT8PVB3_9ENTR|nr:TIGR03747 family integrating conjugative element membrane protein [Citrobacter enshiensis]MDN8600300.1 TIGR03747 family integrating conjugative element membrane protein [Citrobacter enshiensis]
MSDATSGTQNRNIPGPNRGFIATLLSSLGKMCTTLIGSLFFSLMVEWAGMTFLWPEQGVEHSHWMLNTELGWFAQNVTQSLLMDNPARQLNAFLHHLWQGLFLDTGFMPWLEQLRHQPAGHWIRLLETFSQATVYIFLTFVLRVFILLLTLPLFVLAALTGMTDGLVRRDIRRYGRGHESGFIYHHAKRSVMPVFFLTWIVYLSLPFSINPCVILLPSALIFGLSITITTATFKKYL